MGTFSPIFAILLSLLSLSQIAHAACKLIHKGKSSDLLLKGTLLTSAGAIHDTHVLVQSSKITYVGNGSNMPHRAALHAQVLECYDSVISPGFINTHEHIEYSTINPLPDIGERDNHRHDWRKGLRNHTLRQAEVNGTMANATMWGELRHIFSGTTSIIGGGMVSGLARNLDFVAGLEEGLVAPAAVWDTFPLEDVAGILRNGNCDYGLFPIDRETAGKYNRYLAHVSEGIDAEARNEFKCLSNSTFDTIPLPAGGGLSTDIIAPNLALVHALGLSELDFDLVAARGAMVVWSPRSNVFLYGKTLDVSYLLAAGITVALGTDWLPSGSATMAREAVCAVDVMKRSYNVTLEPKTLWEMATINAAKVAGLEMHVGSIEVGKVADIVVIGRGKEKDPFAQAVYAATENIELVVRGGKVLVAGPGLEELAEGDCELVLFGNVRKTVCVRSEIGVSFRDLRNNLGGVYPAVLPGVPKDEPTCVPTR
ncbi:metal dependent amidohydrolase [Melanomma pulvis-pyrius CBS 109.77]|uniref:Metal dependent amidohydrolase n=1 Tax=Melanomma pulvis-pyrius CBS 109.77 TaxID=1314802 RepID=A0A6A6XTZ1_9PLEO|nr:metal dependent amidohydrolase [Melanomma pulvis-pyrius CBS 109.77]